ncbi:MAG TPA: M28 family peptidase [Chitinophagales bacterium]|nr:M28 family peptidase [Chitinophagales bacterium]HQO32141.1 M28 family peptidase [Chitinophagales bacterium]
MKLTKHRKFMAALLLAAFLVVSCKTKQQDTSTENTAATQTERPAFSADSAFAFIEQQLAFGPRVPGTPAQQQCAAYFEQKLKAYGASVILQKTNVTVYSGKSVPCINIVGSYNPEAKRRLLLCTHWDSRPFADQDSKNVDQPILAADDGASGAAVLLEIARQLQQKNPDIGVDLLFIDVEDYGQPEFDLDRKEGDFYCLGAQYWSRYPHVPNYKADNGILLDMVGAKGATFGYEGVSMQYAPEFMKQVWQYAAQLGYGNYFVRDHGDPIIDDHYYINTLAGIPTIDIIHRTYATRSGFGAHWHTHADNIDIIDKLTLQAVGETVLLTLYNF